MNGSFRARFSCALFTLLAIVGQAPADASALTYYEYTGTAMPCPGGADRQNVGCGNGNISFQLWLREDNTLDRLRYSWDRNPEFVTGINRNSIPDYWTTEIVYGENGAVSLTAWDNRWRVYGDGKVLVFDSLPDMCKPPYDYNKYECVSPMPKMYGLRWSFRDLNNWYASYGSQPYQAWLGDPYGIDDGTNAGMGLDNWWYVRGTMSRIPEPGTLGLLGLGALGMFAMRRRKLQTAVAAGLLAVSAADASITLYEYTGTAVVCGGAAGTRWTDGTNAPAYCREGTTAYVDLWLRDDKTPERISYGFTWPGADWYGRMEAAINRSWTDSYTDHITRFTDYTGREWMQLKEYRDYWTCSRLGLQGEPGAGWAGIPDGWEQLGCSPPMPSSWGLTWVFSDLDHWAAYSGPQPYEVRIGDPEERWGGLPANASMGLDNYWWGSAHLTRVPEPGTLGLLGLGALGMLAGRRRKLAAAVAVGLLVGSAADASTVYEYSATSIASCWGGRLDGYGSASDCGEVGARVTVEDNGAIKAFSIWSAIDFDSGHYPTFYDDRYSERYTYGEGWVGYEVLRSETECYDYYGERRCHTSMYPLWVSSYSRPTSLYVTEVPGGLSRVFQIGSWNGDGQLHFSLGRDALWWVTGTAQLVSVAKVPEPPMLPTVLAGVLPLAWQLRQSRPGRAGKARASVSSRRVTALLKSAARFCFACGALVAGVSAAEEMPRADFKGARLGMTIEEWKQLDDGVRAKRHPCRPVAERFRTLGDTECVNFGKDTVAGVPTTAIIYTFLGEELASISVMFGSVDFETVAAALKERFGQPQSRKVSPIQNMAGAIFENVVVEWKVGKDTVELTKFGSRITNSFLKYQSGSTAEEFAARTKHRSAEGKKDL